MSNLPEKLADRPGVPYTGDGSKEMGFPAYGIIDGSNIVNQPTINNGNGDGNEQRFEITLEDPEEYEEKCQGVDQSTGPDMIKRSCKEPNQEVREQITLNKNPGSYSGIEKIKY